MASGADPTSGNDGENLRKGWRGEIHGLFLGGLAGFGLDLAHLWASWWPDSFESHPTLWETFNDRSKFNSGARFFIFLIFRIFGASRIGPTAIAADRGKPAEGAKTWATQNEGCSRSSMDRARPLSGRACGNTLMNMIALNINIRVNIKTKTNK